MNIQEENSAHYFRVQSERKQTLVAVAILIVLVTEEPAHNVDLE